MADAGARSQGAMAGSAIAAGVAVPAAVGIPYVGWLAGGWAFTRTKQEPHLVLQLVVYLMIADGHT